MKKLIFFLGLFLLMDAAIFAQGTSDSTAPKEMKTLFGNNITHGGYGGIMVNYSVIDGSDAILVGARGAWIINHSLGIGIAGYGFTNNIYIDDIIDGAEVFLAGGYGGLLIEPIILPKSPVHISVPILIGAGGMALIQDYYYTSGSYPEYYSVDENAFFVVEPGLEVEFNMVKFMRLALAVTYRHTEGLDLYKTDPHVLDGWSGGITFKFGKF